jgi:bifunctional non-homologous end joining protein LigD
MTLREYRRKRDFRKTPEPRGQKAAQGHGLSFVVQKHDASHLHYDFRLEWAGVLRSWAVPKGPDLNPANKRLAMQVEDHPLEYGGFEGTIPAGEYGGGTVMLWDQGTWEPVGDAAKGFRDGRLKFILHGEKLHGGWMLVRRGGAQAEPGERHWFLFKERDKYAKAGKPITETKTLSVTTGRDLEEIAAQSDRVWGPNGEVPQRGGRKQKPAVKAKSTRKRSASTATRTSTSKGAALHTLLALPNVKTAKLPLTQHVELATLAKQAPEGDDWLHEIKFDGYRMLCRIDGDKARFISRNGHEWTRKFPELAAAAARLPVKQAMLDGEVVALEPNGVTRFQGLQQAFQTGRTGDLAYFVFDVLHVDGRDVTRLPLVDRKKIAKAIVTQRGQPSIRYSDHLEGSGEQICSEACRLHLEGIVSKRRDSAYRPGRGLDWLKVKCSQREEFVIGGFTAPGGSRDHFGAILIGYHDQAGKLVYAGRVGTGFDQRTLAALHRKFAKLKQARSPFANLAGTTGAARGVTWLRPKLVAEIEFSNWTDDGLLRHPAFQGLREDKPAQDVVRDEPISSNEVKALQRQPANGRAKQRAAASKNNNGKIAHVASRNGADIEVAGVRLSHPDKVLYPAAGISKHDLANYYAAVAEWMLPHVVHRPLAVVRCPAGQGGKCFFQKHPGEGAAEELREVDVAASGESEFHLAIDDLAGLVALVQMSVLEIHVWGSRVSKLESPDRLTFDLDPDPTVQWPAVVRAARDVRATLEELGLTSFLKTTGGKGLHVVVPIQPKLDWDEAKAFCKSVTDLIVGAAPDRYVGKMSKAARKGKIFIDYLRNGRGATAVAAYSTRARSGATVSTPIAWDELTARMRSDHFTIANVPMRLARLKHDPWEKIGTTRQSITQAMRKRLALALGS